LILKIKIILASTSRYRADLLKRLQIPFDVAKPAIDESPHQGENPSETALRLAIAKALVVADAPNQNADTLVIGSDQVADLNGKQLGKPGTRANAIMQLQAMRGQTVIFHTAVALVHVGSRRPLRVNSRVVPTEVTFRDYSDRDIENYLDREDALDCAGSAKSEGLGAALIARMTSDDPTALIGLPLLALVDMLAEENVRVLA
jgi:septum formation protein